MEHIVYIVDKVQVAGEHVDDAAGVRRLILKALILVSPHLFHLPHYPVAM